MKNSLFTVEEIFNEALKQNPKANLNELHKITFLIMIEKRQKYYQAKVEAFLEKQGLDKEIKDKLKKAMLQPVKVKDIEYSNFMEEASRRISQVFQVVSGNLAERVVERELNLAGLIKNYHYTKRKGGTDFIIYHPQIKNQKYIHRIEVKNVKLRERATRGLAFDGDSLIGFFNDPSEFTTNNINIIDSQCKKTGGYCYIPPSTLEVIKNKVKGKRFKPNTKFAFDMRKFVKTGII